MLWTEYNALAIRLTYALQALRIQGVTWDVMQVNWNDPEPLKEQTQQFNIRAVLEGSEEKVALVAIDSKRVEEHFADSVKSVAIAGCEQLDNNNSYKAVAVL